MVTKRKTTKLRPPRLKLLGRILGLRVYLVSGEKVRNEFHIDFTQGGHEGVYSYVPQGEVWLDDAMHGLDRTATLLHEIVERDLMMRRGMEYEPAHDFACAFEIRFRRELRKGMPRDPFAAVEKWFQIYKRDYSDKPVGVIKREPLKQIDGDIARAIGRADTRRVGS